MVPMGGVKSGAISQALGQSIVANLINDVLIPLLFDNPPFNLLKLSLCSPKKRIY